MLHQVLLLKTNILDHLKTVETSIIRACKGTCDCKASSREPCRRNKHAKNRKSAFHHTRVEGSWVTLPLLPRAATSCSARRRSEIKTMWSSWPSRATRTAEKQGGTAKKGPLQLKHFPLSLQFHKRKEDKVGLCKQPVDPTSLLLKARCWMHGVCTGAPSIPVPTLLLGLLFQLTAHAVLQAGLHRPALQRPSLTLKRLMRDSEHLHKCSEQRSQS